MFYCCSSPVSKQHDPRHICYSPTADCMSFAFRTLLWTHWWLRGMLCWPTLPRAPSRAPQQRLPQPSGMANCCRLPAARVSADGMSSLFWTPSCRPEHWYALSLFQKASSAPVASNSISYISAILNSRPGCLLHVKAAIHACLLSQPLKCSACAGPEAAV